MKDTEAVHDKELLTGRKSYQSKHSSKSESKHKQYHSSPIQQRAVSTEHSVDDGPFLNKNIANQPIGEPTEPDDDEDGRTD